ncbi:Ser-Asp rich fibrinogen-binding, bone sialoprotein-binding protein [Aphanothece sacrum FPU1]|uniref:Ser-Asp rich fibrinogen-binding, bone sialoprotein-binding protein n=2 Tax=Aphanothece sacrum TaxID=1122 RepID=A0A401ICP0_APHSA|nr:Ser-Asp rich fibrinogen-binding, bone sialoprotein-binding protein [Aphanothece sacrum FPU1]
MAMERRFLDGNGNPITTTTNANGAYSFTGLIPGSYSVMFVAPNGYMFSPSNQGNNDALDSDADGNGMTQSVTLTSGEFNGTLDAGLFRKASLGDFVFEDKNANGIQEAGELGISGVTVKLLDGNGKAVLDGNGNPITTTTNANGAYSFTGLIPGSYSVMFVAPNGYMFSPSNQGNNDALDSDANSNGMTQSVTLTSGEFNGTLDAGLFRKASLGDFVFEDKNANGIQEAGELGISGVTVKLLDGNGKAVLDGNGNPITTTTNANGAYSFTGLIPGSYSVMFVAPNGYMFSPSNQGNNDALDSDADGNGMTQSVTLTSGEFNGTLDAGLFRKASLGDFVFEDKNANGIQEAGELGISGVTVKLLDGNGKAVLDGNGNPITTTTNANGAYSFTGLIPGSYSVMFVAPNGYMFSPSNQGNNDALDSDANSNGMTQSVTLTSGEFNGTLDAGLFRKASLGDFVFEDKNANGIQEAGELGISGVTVKLLDGNGKAVLDGNGNPITTTTNANGAYSFTGLIPGSYSVMFVAPNGYMFSPSNQGNNDALDSDADGNGMTQSVTLTSGEFNGTLDAGLFRKASLGDFVFEDKNANGIQEAGELGVSGVTVTLIGGGADGIINGVGDTTVTTTTNASGIYGFSGLTPGQQYQVAFSNLPAGFQFTQADIGSDALDSDANISTGKTQIVTLSSGENNLTLDAGIYKNAGDLSITKTDGLTTVTPGQKITYTIVAQNNGLITATNALVTDIMPTNLTNVTWTSVATAGATGNDLTGTGNINDTVTLAAGSSITYTVVGTVAASTTTLGSAGTFSLDGNSALDGPDGNIRTFTATNGVQVKASAFSQLNGTTWSNAYLGSYGGGLGVTNPNEGDGSNNMHVVDNSGSNDYILFEFSESVVVDKASLGFVVGDSDISVWIGTANNPFTNHLNLNSTVLSSLGFTEVNNGGSSTRTADINSGNVAGNVLVIAAKIGETDDNFKVNTLNINKVVQSTSSLINTATITGPTGFTDTNPNNNSATDTNTIGVPTVKIGDRVWFDTNGNGIQDTGESGVAGVTVNLLNQAGTKIGTTTTDANGLYQFTANANSTYSVQFVQPTGFNGFTTANVSNNTLDTTDSDVVNSNGSTANFTVGTTDNLTIDAGLIKNNVDLSITKTDGLTTVFGGQQITYTIVVGNNGPMTATNALVSDVMPTNLTGVTWTSVATPGATGNDLTGTGNINDYVTLASGSTITYTVKGTVAASTTSLGSAATFNFTGNTALDGTDGNTRTFTAGGINVTASAFSRVDGTNGAWAKGYLGSYGGGLGVTDSSEGNGANNTHTVDNVGGRNNYVLFQFSESVVLDKAYLGFVVDDSDISLWIGNFGTPITTLSDSVLNSFGFTEVNDTTLTTARWADVNAGNYAGNTIVIAAFDSRYNP